EFQCPLALVCLSYFIRLRNHRSSPSVQFVTSRPQASAVDCSSDVAVQTKSMGYVVTSLSSCCFWGDWCFRKQPSPLELKVGDVLPSSKDFSFSNSWMWRKIVRT
ncbi:hypothetical protein RRG08_010755, partial [Elysia crispata]